MANEPITREEIMLNAIATGEVANLEPITREEMFLAKLGGADVKIPNPITRKEQFLQKAIEGGGTGGGDSAMLDAMIDGSITEISSNVESISMAAFSCRNNLTTANFPKVTAIGGSAFNSCTNITALILRNTSGVCTLSASNAFLYSAIENGRGYIYVPSALIKDYKAATNWSTHAARLRALEDYTVDGTTTGALDPTKI